MPLLPRKGVLAVAAVIDVAMQERGHPISAKTLAARHGLPPRHLEPVLQALVRCGILKGVRGPRGGYELGRDSELLSKVVLPALAGAEQEFGVALARINIEDMARDAQSVNRPAAGRIARA